MPYIVGGVLKNAATTPTCKYKPTLSRSFRSNKKKKRKRDNLEKNGVLLKRSDRLGIAPNMEQSPQERYCIGHIAGDLIFWADRIGTSSFLSILDVLFASASGSLNDGAPVSVLMIAARRPEQVRVTDFGDALSAVGNPVPAIKALGGGVLQYCSSTSISSESASVMGNERRDQGRGNP